MRDSRLSYPAEQSEAASSERPPNEYATRHLICTG
jgi:hypothetical protein